MLNMYFSMQCVVKYMFCERNKLTRDKNSAISKVKQHGSLKPNNFYSIAIVWIKVKFLDNNVSF